MLRLISRSGDKWKQVPYKNVIFLCLCVKQNVWCYMHILNTKNPPQKNLALCKFFIQFTIKKITTLESTVAKLEFFDPPTHLHTQSHREQTHPYHKPSRMHNYCTNAMHKYCCRVPELLFWGVRHLQSRDPRQLSVNGEQKRRECSKWKSITVLFSAKSHNDTTQTP